MFNPNTAFSRQGEYKARKILEGLGWACFDVSDIKTTWKADFDLIATRGEEARIVEVKYDSVMARTGNIPVFPRYLAAGNLKTDLECMNTESNM